MKRNKIFAISLAVVSMLLTSCGDDTKNENNNNSNNNENPDTFVPDTTPVAFEDAYNKILLLSDSEAKNASNVKIETTTQAGSLVNKKVENYIQYADETSSSSGTFTRLTDGVETYSTTFNSVKTKLTDKYKIEGEVYSFDMFTQVIDYEDDNSPITSIKDSYVKKFIVNSDSEAQQGGLDSDEYILASNFVNETSAKSSILLANFIAYCISSNVYITQLGLTTFNVSYDETSEQFIYSFNASYSYDGDLNNTVEEYISLSYILNKSKTNLLSYDSEYKTIYKSTIDEDDQYVSTNGYKATITYGTKPTEKDSSVINANSYFLESISEIGLLARNSNFNDINVDPSAVPESCSYIFGYAKTYSPKKALNVSLNPISSSNPEVIEFSSDTNEFHILSKGTSTLTFGYYKKFAGVYSYTTTTVDVTITDAQVESIKFIQKTCWYAYCSLVEGQTYNWDISVSPSKASKAITAVSSDPTVLEVSVDEDNNLILNALKEGPATITVTSVATPSVSASYHYYVLSSSEDYEAYLTNNSFLHKSPYGYTFTLTFNKDGTGQGVQLITEGEHKDETINSTFTWTLEGTVVKFSNWSKNTDSNCTFDTGTICRYIDTETGDPEEMGLYCETSSLGKDFVKVEQ